LLPKTDVIFEVAHGNTTGRVDNKTHMHQNVRTHMHMYTETGMETGTETKTEMETVTVTETDSYSNRDRAFFNLHSYIYIYI